MRSVVWQRIRCRHHKCLCTSPLSRQAAHGWRPSILCRTPSRLLSNVSNILRSDPTFFSTEFDVGFHHDRQSQDAVLSRAKVHGINTLDRLAFEADLGPIRQSGTRLLEDDSTRQDLDLWAIVLDYRHTNDGLRGVKDVISAMLHAGEPVCLYMDAVSEHIWQTVLPVILSEERLLYEVCQIGSSLMRNRPTGFADVVGQLLALGNMRLAITFATQYLTTYFRGASDIMRLFDIAFRLCSDVGIDNFCRLIARLPRHHVYDKTVPKLWKAGRKQHAFVLHRHLLSLGDYPQDFEQIEPFIREIAIANMELEPFLYELACCGISYSHQARRLYKQERFRLKQSSNRSTSPTVTPGPGARPVKLSDAFVARTFATRSVSFDFVLSGLRFVGLFELGPQAVRELALSTEKLQDLQYRFRRLDEMEVDLGASNYVRVIKNLCMSGENELLRSIVNSDMHHDVFEDIQMQKRLLLEYQRTFRWLEYDRTLAVLSGGQTNNEATQRAARQSLQAALIHGDWRGIVQGLDEMRSIEEKPAMSPHLAPIRLALKRIWASTDLQKRADMGYLQRYMYLVGLMQNAQSAGLPVKWWQWRSVFHAVGRSGDWKLFHRLVLTITRMYYETSPAQSADNTSEQLPEGSSLDTLFDGNMQSLIIEVGLTANMENGTAELSWLRGVGLLRVLANRFKVKIDHASVSAAFKFRLEELFSGTDSGMQRRFTGHYMSCMNWAWAETEVQSQGQLPHAIYQRGIFRPDRAPLRLLQLRSRLVRQRRHRIGSGLTRSLDEEHMGVDELDMAKTENGQIRFKHNKCGLGVSMLEHELDTPNDGAVFYSDLLRPSYKRSGGTQPK